MYSNSGTLHKHKATKHSDLKKFNCDVCGKMFSLREELQSHKVSHIEKTLKCTLCPLMFRSEEQLKRHGKVHLGAKEYQCRTCWKLFTQNGSRKRHELLHVDPKEECDICNRKFPNTIQLQSHRRTHKSHSIPHGGPIVSM